MIDPLSIWTNEYFMQQVAKLRSINSFFIPEILLVRKDNMQSWKGIAYQRRYYL